MSPPASTSACEQRGDVGSAGGQGEEQSTDVPTAAHEPEHRATMRSRRARPAVTPVQRAVGLLRRREHSRAELQRKLIARGVEDAQACQAVARVAEAGWQDDARFAEMLVRTRVASGYGPRYIEAELATHGIEGTSVAAAVAAAFDAQSVDWTAQATELITRRFDRAALADVRIRRKAMDLLLRRGFAPDHCHAALQDEPPG